MLSRLFKRGSNDSARNREEVHLFQGGQESVEQSVSIPSKAALDVQSDFTRKSDIRKSEPIMQRWDKGK